MVSYIVTMRSAVSRGRNFSPELRDRVGAAGGVFTGALDRHLVEAHLLGARAGDVGELHGLVVEIALGEVVQAVAVLAAVEHEGQQHRVVDRRDPDAVLLEHVEVVLDVVADLEHARVLEQGPELLDHGLERELVGQQRVAAPLFPAPPRIEPHPCASPAARWPIGR
jgi:hypothetical protein